jgi:hypothetical protein
MIDPKMTIADIEAGELDDGLAEIVVACRERAQEADRSLRWRITLDGDTWDEDTITIGEMRFVERHTGVNWSEVSPLLSADMIFGFVVAHYVERWKMEVRDAWDKAGELNAKALIEAVSEYQVDEPPKGPAASTR